MEVWTMKVMLGIVLVLQILVMCHADLKKGDPGTCLKYTTDMQPYFQSFPASKKCSTHKGYSECTKAEAKSKHYGRGLRCCKRKAMKKTMEVVCCDKWDYDKTLKKCVPQCKLGCVGGQCVSPDVCECERPLILVDGHQCVQPVCELPCVSGTCVANNTCECLPGHKRHNSTHCAKECDPGYSNDPTTLNCVPQCSEPCLNGTCTSPDTCTCVEGYIHETNFKCIPNCSPKCVNAECVAPNTCFCHPGYTMKLSNTSCSPVCDDCEHGICIGPNVCKCNIGYIGKDGHCIPQCSPDCIHGVCTSPNVCKCDDGYEYARNSSYECVPKCEPECINAECIEPNKCRCLRGYKTSESDVKCEPVCENCIHGKCMAPDNCVCDYGYIKSEEGKCEPHCDRPCSNGVCSEPNVCTCKPGYKLNSARNFSCEPVCEKNCINATCTLPDTCSCLSGFERTENDNICKPKCTSCVHGQCVAPNECVCDDGYDYVGGHCMPVCAVPCINANCTSPNNCTCLDGFEKQFESRSVCHKPCTKDCGPGVCSLYGICQCDSGNELVNDTCVPIPRVDCKTCDYNCTSEKCWCADGKPCIEPLSMKSDEPESTSLAGIEITWASLGAIGGLLLILMLVVMHRIYKKRKEVDSVVNNEDTPYGNGTVLYTVPNTLIQSDLDGNDNEEDGDDTNNDFTKTDLLLAHDNEITNKTQL